MELHFFYFHRYLCLIYKHVRFIPFGVYAYCCQMYLIKSDKQVDSGYQKVETENKKYKKEFIEKNSYA